MTLRTGHLLLATTFLAATPAWGADAPVAATPPVTQITADASPATSNGGLAQGAYTNGIAAVVNGKIITMTELIKECRPLLDEEHRKLETKYAPTEAGANAARDEFVKYANDLGSDILHGMVDRVLIVDEFRAKGYKFPVSYLDWQFDDSITTTFQGDHEKYLLYLQAHGLTEADYRRQLEERDIVDAMMQQSRATGTGISPNRIHTFYDGHKEDFFVKESVKVRRITLDLTPVADATPELFMQQAAKIVAQARQPGANFVELAKQYSTDPSTRSGDLTPFVYYRDDKSLAPALQEAVFKLQPGEVSDPLVNGKFIFIYKCEDHTPEGYLPLDKVRTSIEELLASQDEHQAEEKWLQKLRDKAFIQYYIYGTPVAATK